MSISSWEVWRAGDRGRPVAIVYRTGLGYWLTPSVTSGVLPSTTLHDSRRAVQDALAHRFGAPPERFSFRQLERRT